MNFILVTEITKKPNDASNNSLKGFKNTDFVSEFGCFDKKSFLKEDR